MILILLLLILPAYQTNGAYEMKQEFGSPIIILTEYDPWAMAIGSDTPTFAMYDNGIILYKDYENRKIFCAKLSVQEKEEFLKSLRISENLLNLDERMSVSNWTDQPTIQLEIKTDIEKTIVLYGDLRDDEEARAETPEEFIFIYDKLISYKNSNEEEWLPEKIEVLVWEFNHSRGFSAKWPKEWPDLNDENTIIRGNMYSIYIDKKYYKKIKKLITGLKESQAIKINGQKYTASIRLPFPGI